MDLSSSGRQAPQVIPVQNRPDPGRPSCCSKSLRASEPPRPAARPCSPHVERALRMLRRPWKTPTVQDGGQGGPGGSGRRQSSRGLPASGSPGVRDLRTGGRRTRGASIEAEWFRSRRRTVPAAEGFDLLDRSVGGYVCGPFESEAGRNEAENGWGGC